MQTAVRLISLQRQALQTMRKLGLAANSEAVERWIQDNSNPTGGEANAKDLIARTAGRFDVQQQSYIDLVAFRLSWRRYLAKHLNKTNIAKHFQNQTPRFDGTRFKIWIVSATAPAGQSQQRQDTTEALASLAERFEQGAVDAASLEGEASKHDWDFAPEHWISGTGQLDPTLIDTIMKLDENAVSRPLHTAGGVHLIQLIEKEPGSLELAQVQDEVRAHMLIFLLEHLAAQSREKLPLTAASK